MEGNKNNLKGMEMIGTQIQGDFLHLGSMEDGNTTVVQCDAEIYSSSSSTVDKENSRKLCMKSDCDEAAKREGCNLLNEVSDTRDAEAQKKVNGELENVEKTEEDVSNVPAGLSDETTDAFNKTGNTKHAVNRKRKLIDIDEKNSSDDELEVDKETANQEVPAVEFKGFKKRILAQTEKLKTLETSDSVDVDLPENKSDNKGNKSKLKKGNSLTAKAKLNPEKNQSEAQLTEYAQYLGLQPTVKFKCARCGEKGFQSMGTLHCHQKMCGKSGTASNSQQPSLSIDTSPSTNFRITRKVYLCSACGTYYENWNLFLHMREMHKRYICLFCLGMFSAVEKLAEHLSLKHNIQESNYTSSDDFHAVYKGTVYLMCCTCEQMFTERDNFFEHLCKEPLRVDLHHKCALCGVKGGHFHTCPNNNVHTTAMTTQALGVQTPFVSQNSSIQSVTVTKYLLPIPKNSSVKWSPVKSPTPSGELNKGVFSTPDYDDEYDISDAASFCHVDIGDEGIEKSDLPNRSEDEKLIKEVENSDIVEISSCDQSLMNKCVESNGTEQENIVINDSVKEYADNGILNANDNVEKPVEKGMLDTENNTRRHAEKSMLETNENMKRTVDKGTLGTNDLNRPDEKIILDTNDDNTKTPVEKETLDTNESMKKIKSVDSEINIREIKEKIEEKLKSLNTDSQIHCDNEAFEGEVVGIKDNTSKDNLDKYVHEKKTEEKDVFIENRSEHTASKTNCGTDEIRADDNLQESADKEETEDSSENKSKSSLDLDSAQTISLTQDNENVIGILSNTSRNCEQMKEQGDENIDSTLGNFDDDSNNVTTMQKNNIEESKPEELERTKNNDSMYSKEEVSKNDTHSPKIPSSENQESIFHENNSKSAKNNSVSITEHTDISEKNCSDDRSSSREENSNLQSNYKECSEGPTSSDNEDSEGNVRRKETANNEAVNEPSENKSESNTHQTKEKQDDDGIQLANEDVPAMALTLEGKLDEVSAKAVVKECVRTSCTTCVYCSHAVKIAVNGKQLALHLLAEHRYTPVKNETVEDVISKLKKSLTDLEDMYFNTDSYDSTDKSYFTPYDHTYECFQCHFSTKIHKELYGHKRKMHQKTILLCVMCKSNFYSYSELLCHMCPGIYVSEDILFRCCFCSLDRIPSAFRLMVHLRKTHHTCDICLEVAGDQQKLSTHMWKHKLHHLCYRCGIAYRNKPDITKHLFWKHGTESVLCKRCLQKKWPHVYHFCIPPTVFICEECNASFSKAVALKVHKRLHAGDTPYACSECGQTFVSKKLMKKHEDNHNQVIPENKMPFESDTNVNEVQSGSTTEEVSIVTGDEEHGNSSKDIKEKLEKGDSTEILESKARKKRKKEKDKKAKTVVDVYDLPPLNLSSESDDSEEENKQNTVKTILENPSAVTECVSSENSKPDKLPVTEPEESEQPVTIVDGVWDNFHSYKAQLEKKEAMESSDVNNVLTNSVSPLSNNLISSTTSPNICSSNTISLNIIMADHDYCLQNVVPEQPDDTGSENITKTDTENPAPREHSSSIDHDYCTFNVESQSTSSVLPVSDKSETAVSLTNNKKKQKSPKKKVKTTNSSSSSDSSSDSDSSSCSCGTNCSCSSSSSNSSSSSSSDSDSSSSEGKRRASARKEKRRERAKAKKKDDILPLGGDIPQNEEEPVIDLPVEPIDTPIRESDLDTDESSTDEDFYDKYPQRHANQLLAEKRNQLMLLATVAPINNGTVSPTPTSEDILQATPNKHKLKSKKRRKSQQSKLTSEKCEANSFQENQPSTSFPTSKSVIGQTTANNTYNTMSPLHPVSNPFISDTTGSGSETESTRLSKRKRVRNKFYGYSSDEDEEKQTSKFKKVDPVPVPQLSTPGFSFQPSLQVHRPVITTKTDSIDKNSDSSGSDVETKKDGVLETSSNSSSESSSDSEAEVNTTTNITEQTEKSDNLYCYCQCPYDEVSEMIACDGQDCTIEWFHFECVGIMVPPKGKWYCPDCRKRRDM